ncbi:phosphoribosylglycinamide formyltransferase [Sanguibacter sp. HDW7]|uniref:phosphoribosylglycinamide formyltransferase n=1 Tax=Sanguibacter sp. HDW7 TaxID=2714931 RepID=UPI00140C3B8B|nr:phosphoribosylglycinamide formyltransferase [Sanguibacter sp. HDW7]QIK82815.1 phosphoribosylglycinamide formyltransferase [Sanguibacter sp. HDW7]
MNDSSIAPHPSAAGRTDVVRLVVLVSGTGSNLRALLDAHDDPAYGARVVGVVADRPGIGGLDHARDAGVPTAVVRVGDFGTRAEWDAALTKAVAVFSPDWVVSAGFMKIVGEAFLARFGGRTLNTHPALLPSYPGAHGVRDALAGGARVTGATMHVVDAGVDTGPIVAQVAVDVTDDDIEETLHERIKVVERAMLVENVGRIARGGLIVDGRRTRIGR